MRSVLPLSPKGRQPLHLKVRALHRGATRCLPVASGARAPTGDHSRAVPGGTRAVTPQEVRPTTKLSSERRLPLRRGAKPLAAAGCDDHTSHLPRCGPRHRASPKGDSCSAADVSPSPLCDTEPASGPRSLCSDRRPLPLCPGRDTSLHTSKGVIGDDALLQKETAAPPRGESPSPLLDAMTARGSRNSASGRRLPRLPPLGDSSSHLAKCEL